MKYSDPERELNRRLEQLSGELAPELERPVSDRAWLVPGWLDHGANWLYWAPVGFRLARPGPNLLRDFARLSLASEGELGERVLAYSRRWGVLNLCLLGLPVGHPRLPGLDHSGEGSRGCWMNSAEVRGKTVVVEQLAAWRRYSNALRALISIREAWSDGRKPRPSDRAALLSKWIGSQAPMGHFYQRAFRQRAIRMGTLKPKSTGELIAGELNLWLSIGRVRPWVDYQDGAFVPYVTGLAGGAMSGLFGALATQTMLAVCGVKAMRICRGCLDFFVPGNPKAKTGAAGEARHGRKFCRPCIRASVPVKMRVEKSRRAD